MPTPDNLFIEYELTYLAREIPAELAGVKPQRIVDVYFPETAAHPDLRLRQRGDRYEITKKVPLKGKDSSIQTEQTIPLTADEFAALSVVSKRTVAKDRYAVVIDGHPAEVDVFDGRLKGLVMIDFEFTDADAKAGFTPPACCLADVTQELFAAGGQVAGKSYQDIAADLKRFNYAALDY